MHKFEKDHKNRAIEYGIIILKNGKIIPHHGDSEGINWEEKVKGVDLTGAILSHNHPNGTPPSGDDIRMLVDNKMKSVRVVTTFFGKTKKYSISYKGDGKDTKQFSYKLDRYIQKVTNRYIDALNKSSLSVEDALNKYKRANQNINRFLKKEGVKYNLIFKEL